MNLRIRCPACGGVWTMGRFGIVESEYVPEASIDHVPAVCELPGNKFLGAHWHPASLDLLRALRSSLAAALDRLDARIAESDEL